MLLNYIGPLCVGPEHPLAHDIAADRFPPSCFLVEVRAGTGVQGQIIEGDVLVVDEARPVQHADLVVVETGEGLSLFFSHRMGGRYRLMPANGGQGHSVEYETCRGVVVRQARMYVA